MSTYTKQNFIAGQILTAQALNHIENGIEANDVAVAALSEEKANKTEIPDPYTLPTASADTLGGVKVGDGLEITDGVLGVKPENVWELIEEIVLTEDTRSITRTEYPDGSLYKLSHISSIIWIKQGSSTSDGAIMIKASDDSGSASIITNMVNSTRDSIFSFEGNIERGKYDCQVTETGINYDPRNIKSSHDLRLVDPTHYIKEFYMMAFDGTTIPTGSTITIYGVRSNA